MKLPSSRLHVLIALVVSALFVLLTAVAGAEPLPNSVMPNPDVQHLHYRYGPLEVTPGGNEILVGVGLPKPNVDGYMVRFKPDITYLDGTVPRVDVLHLHHAVFLNVSQHDATVPWLPERFAAVGEEKTILTLPPGYGYPMRASDRWVVNYMLHDLTDLGAQVYITYDIDFVPKNSPTGRAMTAVRPIWMDVENPSAYPVFDAPRSAGTDGRFTFPDQAKDPYGRDPAKNEWTVDHDGTLIWTAGHLHPGGLYDDLDLVRPGATISTPPPVCRTVLVSTRSSRRSKGRVRRRGHARRTSRGRRRSHARHTRAAAPKQRSVVRCSTPDAPIPGPVANSVRLFRSQAVYYDPNGPVSWDLSMTASPHDWRIGVKKGDKLRISVTSDTSRSAWYEGMGIMLVWMADQKGGPDPFKTAVDQHGAVTHGHLPENGHYGGVRTVLPNPLALAGGFAPANTVDIVNFGYTPGGLTLGSPLGNPPVIRAGQSLTFVNLDAARLVHHTITACREPCNLETGVSYPIANAQTQFDSGQLGYGPPALTAAANRATWFTPRNLAPGTYTFFCRIHPFMRGAFRVIG